MTDEDFAKLLGKRIRFLRKLKGISQLELAYDMDMSMNTISTIELGKISPKIETLNKIAQKLDVNLSELFVFSEKKLKNKKLDELFGLLNQENDDFIEAMIIIAESMKKIKN